MGERQVTRKAPLRTWFTFNAPLRSIPILPWPTAHWVSSTPISGAQDRAIEYITKAFQLRQHASEREQLGITADYYQNVTGELNKAARTFQEWIEIYPRSPPAYGKLGIVYAEQGQYEKAADITMQAAHVAPSDGAQWL